MDPDWHDLLDELMEIPHGFEVDLRTVVISNLELLLKSIEQEEDKEVSGIQDELKNDEEAFRSLEQHLYNAYESLRQAARRLALVGAVTRLQHWIATLAKSVSGSSFGLVKDLDVLNARLGIGPIPLDFFEKIVTLRDSIIHADSQAEWQFKGKKRKVAVEYTTDFGDVDISEDQLKEVFQNSIEQVRWYDAQVNPRKKRP